MKTVAMYDPENRILNFNCSQCERVAWKGNHIDMTNTRASVLYTFLLIPYVSAFAV